MKANRRQKTRMMDRAEVGVGTLIVFIAMVLVAAVAAAVLISTSGTLQQRAQKTGEAATQQVSSNLLVSGIYANQTDSKIGTLEVHITLAPGAVPVDLTRLQLRLTDGVEVPVFLTHSSSATSSSEYKTYWMRGAGTNSVMESGDLVNITIDLYKIGSGYKIDPRDNFELMFLPEAGVSIKADFRAPDSFPSEYVTIR